MKNITVIGWYLIGLLTFILLMFLAFETGRWTADKAKDGTEDVRDTVIRVDTLKVPTEVLQTQIVTQEVIKYKYVPVVVTDTFVERDTVIQVHENIAVIPISRKEYTDSQTYRAVVTGYDPKLEEIEVYRENTEITIRKKEKQRWGVGVQAGAGVGLTTRKPDLYIGLGASYNLWP